LAIGAYVARRTGTPRLVALIPQAEQIDAETKIQVKPPGINLIILPFSEELRSLKDEDAGLQPAEPDLVDKAKEIIAKLTITGGFDPESFQNPALQRHYASLQALALDQEMDEGDLKDSVKPDTALMQKRAGPLIDEFVAMIPATEEQPIKIARKRTSPSDDSGPIDVSKIANDAEKLEKLTMPVLKEYALSIGIKPARIKAELICQILAASNK